MLTPARETVQDTDKEIHTDTDTHTYRYRDGSDAVLCYGPALDRCKVAEVLRPHILPRAAHFLRGIQGVEAREGTWSQYNGYRAVPTVD